MTFSKPNMKYTDMAIWIDTHAYDEECDTNTLFQYLYHLTNMCAHQLELFHRLDDYDQFSLYCASRLIQRIRRPENLTSEKRIKSILNYLKFIIQGWKADYELEFHIHSRDYNVLPIGCYELSEEMSEMLSYHDVSAYSFTCDDVVDVVDHHLGQIPRKRKSSEWVNIYVSCMLTLADRIHFAVEAARARQTGDKCNIIDKAFQDASARPPILFHLPDSMRNYISVLVIEIQHAIAAEISYQSKMKITSVNTIKGLMYTALSEED